MAARQGATTSRSCPDRFVLRFAARNSLGIDSPCSRGIIQLRGELHVKISPAVIVFLLSAGVALPAKPSARLMKSTYAYLDGQKAEPNQQIPATPQANTGNPTSANSTLEPNLAGDAALQGRIQQALSNEPTLGSSHITVNVTDSAIELSGTAASIQDKQTAERIAESFDGNREFHDKLVVTGQRLPATSTPNNGSKTGGSNTSGATHPQM
jgi:hypothetical protein